MNFPQVPDISNAFSPLRELAGSLSRAAAGQIPVGSERQKLLECARAAGPAALPKLLRSLTSESESEASWAYFILSQLGGDRIIARVASIAADSALPDHAKVRALGLLTQLGAPMPGLVTLADPDGQLRDSILALLQSVERGELDMRTIFEQVPEAELPTFATELYQYGGARALLLVERLLESDSLSSAVRQALESLAEVRTNGDRGPLPADTLERGVRYLEAGRPKAALAHLRRFVESRPAHPKAQSTLGICLLELGQADEALEHLRLAVELDAKEPLHHWNLAAAYNDSKRHGGCYLALREYLALRDDSDRAFERRAEASARMADYEQSLFKAGVMPQSDVPHLPERFARAHATLLESRPAEAAKQFEAIVELAPNHHPSWTYLGAAYVAVDRIVEARACFERALNLKNGTRSPPITIKY